MYNVSICNSISYIFVTFCNSVCNSIYRYLRCVALIASRTKRLVYLQFFDRQHSIEKISDALGSLGCAVNVKKGAVCIESTRPNTGKINVYHCMLLIIQPRAV
jgi:hypothetical protein